MVLAFVLSSLIYINATKASEEVMADISTDVSIDTFKLVIDTNNEEETINSFSIDNYENGHLTKRHNLLAKTFINEGIKIPVKGKIAFARIYSENFDEEQGGMIVIDTLYNLLTGNRKSYEVFLAKDRRGWKLFKSGKVITHIKAIAHKIPVVGIVGAKDLIMN
jgi:hypothetical protein